MNEIMSKKYVIEMIAMLKKRGNKNCQAGRTSKTYLAFSHARSFSFVCPSLEF